MISWLYKSKKLRSFFASIWSTFLTSAVLFGGGALFTIGMKDPNNPVMDKVVQGLIVLVFGWFLTHVAKKFESESKEAAQRDLGSAKRKALAAYNDKLGHIYALLTRVANPTTRGDSLEAYIQAVMGSSVTLFEIEGLRACLYILDGDVNDADTDEPALLVHRPPQCGRLDQPRKSFAQDTPHGELLFQVLATRKPLHIADTVTTDKAIDASDKMYKSFVAVAIVSGMDELGVLTIDAHTSNALQKEHLITAQTIASLLAVGLQLAAPPPGPIKVIRSRSRENHVAASIKPEGL